MSCDWKKLAKQLGWQALGCWSQELSNEITRLTEAVSNRCPELSPLHVTMILTKKNANIWQLCIAATGDLWSSSRYWARYSRPGRYSMMQQGFQPGHNLLQSLNFQHFPKKKVDDSRFRGNLACTLDYIPRHVQFMGQDRILTVHLMVRQISLWHPGTWNA